MSEYRLHAALLAAGRGSRYGSPKQLTEIGGKTMLSVCIDLFKSLPDTSLTVLLGAHSDLIVPHIKGEEWLHVSDWAKGVSESIKCAVEETPSTATHLLIGLGDQPSITVGELASLVSLSRENKSSVVVAEYANSFGPPVVFPRAMFGYLKSLSGDRGAKSILKKLNKVIYHPLPSAAHDIDFPEDLAALHRH